MRPAPVADHVPSGRAARLYRVRMRRADASPGREDPVAGTFSPRRPSVGRVSCAIRRYPTRLASVRNRIAFRSARAVRRLRIVASRVGTECISPAECASTANAGARPGGAPWRPEGRRYECHRDHQRGQVVLIRPPSMTSSAVQGLNAPSPTGGCPVPVQTACQRRLM